MQFFKKVKEMGIKWLTTGVVFGLVLTTLATLVFVLEDKFVKNMVLSVSIDADSKSSASYLVWVYLLNANFNLEHSAVIPIKLRINSSAIVMNISGKIILNKTPSRAPSIVTGSNINIKSQSTNPLLSIVGCRFKKL
jgi:hypothetical protein